MSEYTSKGVQWPEQWSTVSSPYLIEQVFGNHVHFAGTANSTSVVYLALTVGMVPPSGTKQSVRQQPQDAIDTAEELVEDLSLL